MKTFEQRPSEILTKFEEKAKINETKQNVFHEQPEGHVKIFIP